MRRLVASFCTFRQTYSHHFPELITWLFSQYPTLVSARDVQHFRFLMAAWIISFHLLTLNRRLASVLPPRLSVGSSSVPRRRPAPLPSQPLHLHEHCVVDLSVHPEEKWPPRFVTPIHRPLTQIFCLRKLLSLLSNLLFNPLIAFSLLSSRSVACYNFLNLDFALDLSYQ